MELATVGDLDVSVSNLMLTAVTNVHVKASAGVLNLQSGGNTNINATGQIIQTGSQIHLNGPGAASAEAATPTATIETNTFEAFYTSRIPEHEPWARVMTDPLFTDQDMDNSHTDAAEYLYDDPDVGRLERGEDLLRNPKWHR
jgi:hypothetical protein